jgi:hypothetical protein
MDPPVSVKTERRLDVKLTNHDLFAQLMTMHSYTVRSLTDAINLQLAKNRSRHRVTRSVIGHLRTGYRSTVHPEAAEIIAGLFKLPMNALFLSKVSNVQRERVAA